MCWNILTTSILVPSIVDKGRITFVKTHGVHEIANTSCVAAIYQGGGVTQTRYGRWCRWMDFWRGLTSCHFCRLYSELKSWTSRDIIFFLKSECCKSEWVICSLSPTQQFFSYIHGENPMRWWWDPLCTRLSWICIVLAHWNNSWRIDMSPHSDTLFWFRANHYLLFLLNAAWLAEKQQISIL